MLLLQLTLRIVKPSASLSDDAMALPALFPPLDDFFDDDFFALLTVDSVPTSSWSACDEPSWRRWWWWWWCAVVVVVVVLLLLLLLVVVCCGASGGGGGGAAAAATADAHDGAVATAVSTADA